MTGRLRIGSRASPLALAQTELVVRALRRVRPDLQCDVEPIRTAGDRTRRSVGTLDFTDAITRRLVAGELDLGVHSTKDLPATPARGTCIGAYLRRGDARDCLVLRSDRTLRTLPHGARIGSSSARRRAQLLAIRPDVDVVPVRGNVGTRIGRIGPDGLDGIVLAAAGLRRLGWADRVTQFLPISTWLPAPGQGAIAVETRARDRGTRRVLASIDHAPTHASVEAERAVVRALGGDCDLPLGAFARIRADGRLELRAALYSADGRWRLSADGSAPSAQAVALGERVGRSIRTLGDPAHLFPETPAATR